MSRRGGEGPSRLGTWLGIALILFFAGLAYAGVQMVAHSRLESCVREQLAKGSRVHLAVWEAVQRCQP